MDSGNVRLVDTKRATEFINNVERFSLELTASIDNIQTGTRLLGASFHDEHFFALNKSIQVINKNLQNFVDTQKRLTPGLRKKLEDISSYQRSGDAL